MNMRPSLLIVGCLSCSALIITILLGGCQAQNRSGHPIRPSSLEPLPDDQPIEARSIEVPTEEIQTEDEDVSQQPFGGREPARAASENVYLYEMARPSGELATTTDVPNDRDLGAGGDNEPLGTRPAPSPSGAGESYGQLVDNPWQDTSRGQHTSTFSTDIDTAAYANVRRYLQQWQRRPPADAVRVEEMINAFDYRYPQPVGDDPFALHPTLMDCPWAEGHQILQVGVQGRSLANAERPPATLVFLLDVSGSMSQPNKLPLLKKTFGLLVEQLNERDTVAIVTYAGNAGVALPPTPGHRHEVINRAIDNLHAGGSTAGAAGITEAYRLARAHMRDGGQTRVILGTDGDFNVGITDQQRLVELIRREAGNGIFLNVLGFGSGNYQDQRMEAISNDGNGVYAYIDSVREARNVFGKRLVQNLVTLGKDVKVQVFFNPARVAGWRQIGYANRQLQHEDFNNDAVDAGEVGAGHTVTVLYEIVPTGMALPHGSVDANPFVAEEEAAEPIDFNDDRLCRLRLRFKQPTGTSSRLIERDVDADATIPSDPWPVAMAGFGMLLRASDYRGDLDWDGLIRVAQAARGTDPGGERAEAIHLMELARDLP